MKVVEIPREQFQLTVLNTENEEEHLHQNIELLYVLDGRLSVEIDEDKTVMEKNDILVVNANKRHRLNGTENILYMKVMIPWNMISAAVGSLDILFWCNSVKRDNERYEELRKVLRKLLKNYLNYKGGAARFGHIGLCCQLTEILCVNFLVCSSDKVNPSRQDKYDSRIIQINNYIRSNYNMPISLNDLAEKLYLSEGYLSRFFKKTYGMNFASYLDSIRIYYATEELLYTSKPITRIVFDNGFSSVSAFNKSFKLSTGKTPSEMRRQYMEQSKQPEVRTEKEIDQETVKEQLEEFLRNEDIVTETENPSETEAEIIMSGNYELTQYAWKNMINIGSAADLLKSEVREHVMLLQGALKFQYIRFGNIFSENMMLNKIQDDKKMNFSQLDSILDFIMAHGLKPHFELGFKQKQIHESIHVALLKSYEGSEELDYEERELLLISLMKHLVHRYSRQSLDGWRFELWFDEKEWGNTEQVEKYFTTFEKISDILKSYNDHIQIGGSGLRLNWERGTILRFLQKWKSRFKKPDFLSGYYYGYERGQDDRDEFVRRSTDNEHMRHLVYDMRSIIDASGFQDVPLFLTEWNLTISDRNFLNDSCFKGAYIVKNMLDIYGMTSVASYNFGTDRVSEYYDSAALLYGGKGLLAKDGVLKPAGFAFDFLNRLEKYFVGKGNNYIVTTDGMDRYGILCQNQKILNYNYYYEEENKVQKENIWKYFEDRKSLTLNMKLVGLAEGTYKIKIYRVNEMNGNILKIWEELKFDDELSRNDIEYLRRVCEPKLEISKQDTQENTLALQIKLGANEIAYVRIRRLL